MNCSLCNNKIGLSLSVFLIFCLGSFSCFFTFSTFKHTFTIALTFANFSVSLFLITKLLFCLFFFYSLFPPVCWYRALPIVCIYHRFCGFARSTSHRWKINSKSTKAMIIITVMIIPIVSTSPTRSTKITLYFGD